jgi:hypothetical protein
MGNLIQKEYTHISPSELVCSGLRPYFFVLGITTMTIEVQELQSRALSYGEFVRLLKGVFCLTFVLRLRLFEQMTKTDPDLHYRVRLSWRRIYVEAFRHATSTECATLLSGGLWFCQQPGTSEFHISPNPEFNADPSVYTAAVWFPTPTAVVVYGHTWVEYARFVLLTRNRTHHALSIAA